MLARLAALFVGVAACGGGGSSSNANDKPASVDPANACTLLSKAQAESSSGAKLSADPRPDSDPPDGTHGCVFPTGDEKQFAIDVNDHPGLPTFSGLEDVQGVGAAAKYDPRFHRVYVDSGKGTFFQVRFVFGDIDNEKDVGSKIAKTVVDNL